MFYVMSDLHGEYEKFLAMLEQIHFSDSDVLFLLGDVVDRGPKPAELLMDLSMRSNVYPLMGNHELMAMDVLKSLLVEVREENFDTQITPEVLEKLSEWQMNGGDTTLRSFHALPNEDRLSLLEYMAEFEPYQTVEMADGRTFLLVHAGLGNYRPDRSLMDYTLEELCFMRPEEGQDYYDDSVRVVVGHTPTLAITGEAKIHHTGNVYYIDCGAAYGGRLACLCLDNMEEFYI